MAILVEAVHGFLANHPIARKLLGAFAPLAVIAAYIPEVELILGKEALIGSSLALIGGVLVGLVGAHYRNRVTKVSPVTEPGDGAGRLPLVGVARVIWLAAFISAVTFLHRADVAWVDFTRSGLFIVSYSACRLFLALSLLVVFFASGYLVLTRLVPGFRRVLDSEAEVLLLSFFCGATLYGLAFVLLGYSGLIGFPSALILTAPVILFASGPSVELGRSAWIRMSTAYRGLRGPQAWVRVLLVWCTALSGVLIILSRGLYPGQTTNDVWEHYLHYYRDVLASGSIGPHPTWYHFHQSKGAGLFFLAGALSDELSPQLVSTCFIVAAGFITYRVLKRFTGDPSWSLLGVTMFFTTYRGDFFKHHDVLTGYLAFLVWATVEIAFRTGKPRRALAIVLTLVAFYVGFYLPMGSAIIAGFWVALQLSAALVPSWRGHCRPLLPALGALLIGVASTMALNYAATGLAEVVPISLFWTLADVERFDSVFGLSSMASFLHNAGSQLDVSQPMKYWLLQVFRYHHWGVFFPEGIAGLTGIAAVVSLWRTRSLRLPRDMGYPLVVLGTFVGTALLFSLVVRSVSLARLYAFTIPLMTIVTVLLNRAVVITLCTRLVRPWASLFLLSGLAVLAVGQTLWYSDYSRAGVTRQWLSSFFIGRHSMADVMIRNDALFKQHVKLDVVTAMRQQVGRDAAILNLSHDPGPGNAFPGAGLVGGPSHSFGPKHLSAVLGPPEEACAVLQRQGLNYFLFDLRNRPSSPLAFSPLFRPENVSKFLRVLYQSDDSYLLTWRNPRDAGIPLPIRFRQVLELAQTDVLRYANSEAFRQDIGRVLEREVLLGSPLSTERINEGIVRALFVGIGPLVLDENKALVHSMVEQTQQSLEGFLPELDGSTREWVVMTGIPENKRVEAYRAEFGRQIHTTFSKLMTYHSSKQFGSEIGTQLTAGTRNPLSEIFASRENVESILGRTDDRVLEFE